MIHQFVKTVALIFIGVLISWQSVNAQNYLFLGTGTSITGSSQTLPTPFGTYYEDNRTQYLILASELSTPGASSQLLSVGFDVVSASSQVINGLNIKIGHSAQTSLFAYETGLINVYSGNHTAVAGWNQFTFSSPFVWDGVSNIVVELCFDNTSYTANSTVKYTPTTYNSVYGHYADGQIGCSMSSSNGSGLDFQSRPNMRLGFSPPNQNDAAITMLANPTFPTCAMDSVVKVNLVNYGALNLTSATVNWSINGASQTPYVWTGNLVSTTDTIITLGTVTGGLNDGDVLKVWSSQPNGVLDSNNVNDTISYTLYHSLSGTYSINSAGTGDFVSLTDAYNAADAYGICGPTVFEIMDTLLTEQISWTNFTGMSDTNTITITNAPGVSVKVAFSSSSVNENYIFNFTDASNYVVENITLQAVSNTYGGVIRCDGNSENITISNCHLIGVSTTSSWSSDYRVFYLSGVDLNDWTIANNTLENGNYGIYFYGGFASHGSGSIISGNKLYNPYNYGMFIQYNSDLEVSDNYITSNSNYPTGRAIYVSTGTNAKLKNNHIEGQSNWPYYGIYCHQISGDLSEFAPIHNNRIYMPGTDNGYGIYASNGLFTEIAHNSVYYQGGVSARGVYITSGQYNNFINNIVAMGGAGTAVFVDNGSPVYVMDHNNFSAPMGKMGYLNGTFHPTLNAWQNATSFDSNSVAVNSIFSDTSLLRVCSDSLYAMGLSLTHVTHDFEGEPRQSPPCIGADEFVTAITYNRADTLTLCDADTLTLNQFYFDTVVWNGTDTANSFNVSQSGQNITLMAAGGCGVINDTIYIDGQEYAQVTDTVKVCENMSLTLDAGVSNAHYLWSNGDTTFATSINSGQLLWVEVTDSSGCLSSDTVTISQHYNVQLADSTFFCEGDNVMLAPGAAGNYEWNNQTTDTQLVVSQQGYYSVTVTDANCVSSDSIWVEEELDVIPNFSDSSDWHTYIFTNTSTNLTSNCTYLWDFGDGNTSTDQNPIHLYQWSIPYTPTYEVTLHVINRCDTFSITKTVIIWISVSEVQSESNIVEVFPNPVRNQLYIQPLGNGKNMQVMLFDTKGAMLVEKQYGAYTQSQTYAVDVSRLSTGMYVVKVLADGQWQTVKISKQ